MASCCTGLHDRDGDSTRVTVTRVLCTLITAHHYIILISSSTYNYCGYFDS